MEPSTTSDMWSSLYLASVPVVGVFVLAGAVYFLSFRSPKDDDISSLKIYLNVLSGDDEKSKKNRKLRKFGPGKKGTGVASSENNKPSESEAEKVLPKSSDGEPQVNNVIVKKTKEDPVSRKRSLSPKTVLPKSKSCIANGETRNNGLSFKSLPESVVITTPDADDSSLADSGAGSIPAEELEDGWHTAGTRKERRQYKASDESWASRSTASEESRQSTHSHSKNSCSSRNSSPYHLHLAPVEQKLKKNNSVTASSSSSRKSATRNQLLQKPERNPEGKAKQPDMIGKKETLVKPHQPPQWGKKGLAVPPPLIRLHTVDSNDSNEGVVLCGVECSNVGRIAVVNAVDAAVQTDETEDFPSPLEGLVDVMVGQPRFVIMQDFCVQVDLDLDELDSDSLLADGEQLPLSSGGSLSSGEGSTRVTPILDEEHYSTFSAGGRHEKGQGVHQRSSYSAYSRHRDYRHNQYFYQRERSAVVTEDASMFPHAPVRNCREKPAVDWIDGAARRQRPLTNGRWRN